MNTGGQPAPGQTFNGQPQQQSQPGQPGNPQQQQQRKINIFRPEQMRSLPDQFSAEEKLKWENGLRQLWSQMEKNPQDSQPHREAKKKLFEFSKTLTMKLSATRQQQAQQLQPSAQGQQGEGNVARPPSQGQPPQGQASSSAQPNTGQQKQNIPQKLMDHVNSFPYVTPITMVPGSPEAEQWIHEMKGKYLKALTAMENASLRVLQLKSHYDRMQAEGKVFTPAEEEDYQKKSDQAKKGHSDYKQFVDQFRRQQEGFKIARENANAAQGNSAQPTGLNTGANAAVGASANGQNQPPRPQLNLNQPANPALQNTQQTVMGAIEAARNQQMNSGRPPMQNGQASQGMGQGQNPNMPQMPNIKSEQGVPAPINTAVTQMQRNVGPGMQTASPQSAIPRSAGMPQSATSQAPQIPQALSQSDALHQAARRHSSSTSAPNVMGHSHPHPPIARDPPNITNTNKMPIPKHLPERATAPPQPVAMPPNRPSYSGGANNIGNGVMAAPVLPKAPGYHVEGAGGSVLDKKKLDELVRQVTGGGSGLEGGQGLTPEVEESILMVADNFVDQVLQAACKNAKERGSKMLEIRDIQLTLERAYNIRIPGYSSDEIRTVRKIQPAPGWIAKMSAVQAAKVTGGKTSE